MQEFNVNTGNVNEHNLGRYNFNRNGERQECKDNSVQLQLSATASSEIWYVLREMAAKPSSETQVDNRQLMDNSRWQNNSAATFDNRQFVDNQSAAVSSMAIVHSNQLCDSSSIAKSSATANQQPQLSDRQSTATVENRQLCVHQFTAATQQQPGSNHAATGSQPETNRQLVASNSDIPASWQSTAQLQHQSSHRSSVMVSRRSMQPFGRFQKVIPKIRAQRVDPCSSTLTFQRIAKGTPHPFWWLHRCKSHQPLQSSKTEKQKYSWAQTKISLAEFGLQHDTRASKSQRFWIRFVVCVSFNEIDENGIGVEC